MNYVQIVIPISSTSQNEILIALLADIGYESFEEKELSLEAFIKEDNFDKITLEGCLNNISVTYTSQIIPQQNWNAEWEKNFEPITVENFVGVRASFHPSFTNVQHEIVITPKMSFGTGHHATTYLVMQAMEKIVFTNKSVFDFGTGTGILAILAQKLGAAGIVATDYDNWCIENATENVLINNCTTIAVEKNDSIPNGKFDIILANINYNVIVQNLPLIAKACNVGTQLLFSGLLTTDETSIKEHILQASITPLHTTERNGWICIYCKKES